jgi:long-chain-fatty-acid--[acyl-carrier-protein] ligase
MLLLRYLLCGLARCILALRYRVHVDGLDKVRGLKGPVLILPNHPAYVDSAIVLASLWPALKPRPLVFEPCTVTGCCGRSQNYTTRCGCPT